MTVLPLASMSGTIQTVFLFLVLLAGYVVLWAIWHFFFRGAGEESDHPEP